jgi:hypothetical protein
MLMASGELVLGPVSCQRAVFGDDGTAAELALRSILSVELREPLNSGAASLEVCDCVGHLVYILWIGERGDKREERKREARETSIKEVAGAC